MKSKFLIPIFFTVLTNNSFSWTPDTTKLFWNRDFIIEYDYGYSFASMYKLNKYYINDFAKEMGLFNKHFHNCSFKTPSFGFIFINNIINLSGTFSKSKLKGNTLEPYYSSPNLYLFADLWTINLSYRRMVDFKFFLLGLGTSASFGKASADINTESAHESNVMSGNLLEGFGGGCSIFGELDYLLFKHIIIGIRLSGNVFLTETLKNKYTGKWAVGDNENEVNLNYSGFSALIKAGFLW